MSHALRERLLGLGTCGVKTGPEAAGIELRAQGGSTERGRHRASFERLHAPLSERRVSWVNRIVVELPLEVCHDYAGQCNSSAS